MCVCITVLCVSVEAAGGKALPCVVDIRDEQQIGAAVQKAVETFGGSKFFLHRKWLLLCKWFKGQAMSYTAGRYWHPGEQCQRHQFDGNSGDADEESWPDAGNKLERNIPDVWRWAHACHRTHTDKSAKSLRLNLFSSIWPGVFNEVTSILSSSGLRWSSLTCWRVADPTSWTYPLPWTWTLSGSRTTQVTIVTS